MSEESKSWYRMTRPLFNSGFEDDEFWAYGQDGFQEVLDSFIGTDVLIYDKRIASEPQEIRAIVQNKTSDVYNSTVVRQILCNIGILKCGQYVKYDGAFWLVSALPDNNRIYEKAILWKCKHTIRFLSPLTCEIVEYPAYSVNSTQYGDGESNKAQVSIGDDQHLIYVPYNTETILIDNRFRFLIDKNRENPTAYRVTKVDSVSYAVGDEQADDGLIQWTVTQTQFNEETDSKELMVANYYHTTDGDSNAIGGSEATLILTDADGDYKLAIGEDKEIRVACVDSAGIDIPSFAYHVEYDFADGAANVISEEDNTIIIRASSDRRFVGKTISIHAISDSLGSETTMKVKIVNW